MKKFLFTIIVVISLFSNFGKSEAILDIAPSKLHGICIRGEDVKKEGATILFSKLKKMGYNAVFFLAKTPEGQVYFESKEFPISVDVFQEAVSSAKSLGIKFYAYFPVVMDKNYASKNPSEKMVAIGNVVNNYYISLISEKYINYLKSFIKAIINYDVDGIVYDYIRFPSGSYDFSNSFVSLAVKEGINIDKVKAIAYKTFVTPSDWKTMFQAYDDKDLDIVKWVNFRESIVNAVAYDLSNYARSINPNISIGAFTVSRGYRKILVKDSKKITQTWAYQVVNFAQEPSIFKGILDFISPMVYLSNLEETPDYAEVVSKSIKKTLGYDFPVYVAVNPDSISIEFTQKELNYSYKNTEGVVLFRYPLFKMAIISDFNPSCCTSEEITVNFENGSEKYMYEISKSGFVPLFKDYVIISPFFAYYDIELLIGKKVLSVNGEEIEMDVSPFIKDSRTFVPVRFISEALGEKVYWDSKNKVVTILGSATIKLKIESFNYEVNGETFTMDVFPFIRDSRTFVPVRFVSEALDMEVFWDNELKRVEIKGFKRID